MNKQPKLKEGHVWVEVVSGPAGPSLYVGDDNTGYRISGPKPWGGGTTLHKFQVNVEELSKELLSYTKP